MLVEVSEVDFSVRYIRLPVSPFASAKLAPAVSVPLVVFVNTARSKGVPVKDIAVPPLVPVPQFKVVDDAPLIAFPVTKAESEPLISKMKRRQFPPAEHIPP